MPHATDTLDMPRTSSRMQRAAPSRQAHVEPKGEIEKIEKTAKDDETTSNKQYLDLVKDGARDLIENNTRGLEFYYNMGERINDLTDRASRYGEQTVEQYSKDLAAATNIRLGTSTLYKSSQFNRKYTRTELKRAIGSNISWRNIVFMLTAELPDSERKNILARVEANEIEQDQIKKLVDEKVGNSLRKTGRSKKPLLMLGKITSMSGVLTGRVVELDPLITRLQEAKPSTLATYQDAVQAAMAGLDSLISEARSRLKLLAALEFEKGGAKS
jgi:hypothetical protein